MYLDEIGNSMVSARKERDVFLIVCGSASSWIVKNLLKNTEGLYGRITDRIQLKPFTLAECEKFAQRLGLDMTRKDVAEAYMVFGGIPYYWSLLREDLSLAQNIDELLFAADGKLRSEFDYLYASIYRHPEPHLKVIKALFGRKSGLTREEIIAATGLKNGGNFKTVLDELEQCDFIRSYCPVGKKNRGAVYQLIDDNLNCLKTVAYDHGDAPPRLTFKKSLSLDQYRNPNSHSGIRAPRPTSVSSTAR